MSDALTYFDFSDMMLAAVRRKAGQIFICHFDGACDPNPGGGMGSGAHIITAAGHTAFAQSEYTPPAPGNTSNAAEYLAFMSLMNYLTDCYGCTISIFGDSKLVINQMTGRWRMTAGGYKAHALQAKELYDRLRQHNRVKLAWIPRERNQLADDLSKQAIIKAQ